MTVYWILASTLAIALVPLILTLALKRIERERSFGAPLMDYVLLAAFIVYSLFVLSVGVWG